jgi:hypothetical protein
MKIKDQFRGLNLLEDPSQILPGESTVCQDLYLKGKRLVNRDFTRSFDIQPNTNILAMHFAPNLSTTANYLIGVDTSGNVHYFQSGSFSWIWVAELGNTNLCSDEQSCREVRFLTWEDKVIIFRNDEVWIVNNTLTLVKVANEPLILSTTQRPAISVTETGSNPVPSEWSTVSYIVEFVSSTLGLRFYLFNNMVAGATQGNIGTIFLTRKRVEVNLPDRAILSFAIDAGADQTLLSNAAVDTINIYRKMTYQDGTEDPFYYLRETIGYSVGVTFTDNDLTPSALGQTTFDSSIVRSNGTIQSLPSNITAAGWYQGRVVWCTDDGEASFSSLYNPFILPGDLRGNVITSSRSSSIFNFIEYLGTGIFFTEEGLVHLVGEIADEADDSTYRFYTAFEDINCLPMPNVLVIGGMLLFAASDGAYLYDARQPRIISDKIRPYWQEVGKTALQQLSFAYDKDKKIILICLPNDKVLVYHYADQFADSQNPQPGPWTIFKLEANLIFNCSDFLTSSQNSDAKYHVVPGLVKTNYDIELISANGTNTVIDVEWRSQRLDGNTTTTKRWLEAKMYGTGTYALSAIFNLTESSEIERDILSQNIQAKLDVKRGRIKVRAPWIQLKVTSEKDCELIDFEIDAELIGR